MAIEFPSSWGVGGRKIVHTPDIKKDFDGDERGILWIAEPPDPAANYVLGGDAAGGITGWNRYARTKQDKKNKIRNFIILWLLEN